MPSRCLMPDAVSLLSLPMPSLQRQPSRQPLAHHTENHHRTPPHLSPPHPTAQIQHSPPPPGAGTFHIGPFKVPEGSDKAKLKVKVTLNLNGVVTLEQVQLLEELEEEVRSRHSMRSVGGIVSAGLRCPYAGCAQSSRDGIP